MLTGNLNAEMLNTDFVNGRLCVGGTTGQNTNWQHQHDLWVATSFLKLEYSGWTTVISDCVFQGCPRCLCPFPTTIFPPFQLSSNVLGYSTLRTAPFFSHDLLCLTLLVWGVSDHLLNNRQDCSLPHDYVASLNQAERPFKGSGNPCRCFRFIS